MGAVVEYATRISTTLISLLIFFLGNAINLTEFSYRRYPEYTTAVFGLIGIYIVYRTTLRIVKFWWRLFVNTIKVFLLLSLISIGAALYLRGFELFAEDVKFWSRVLKLFYRSEASGGAGLHYGFGAFADVLGQRFPGVKMMGENILKNQVVKDAYYKYAQDTVEYLERNDIYDFEKIQQYVSENIGEAIQGIDFRALENNYRNFF